MIASSPLRWLGFLLCMAAFGNGLPSVSRTVYFEPAQGGVFDYVARTRSQNTFVSATRAIIRRQTAEVSMTLQGAQPSRAEGVKRIGGASNYFIGNTQNHWRRDVPHFGGVRYQAVYPGIDVVYYGNQEQLEFDFVVAPGADPGRIQLQYDGPGKLHLSDAGELLFETEAGRFVQHRPRVYQGTREVASSYRIADGNLVSFALGSYDRSQPLVIDPAIDFSIYYGGAGYESATAMAIDASGNLYVAGVTSSNNLPTSSPLQSANAGGSDAFVAKFTNSGQLVWATYLGGKQTDAANAITVDRSGNIYVSGFTTSMDMPVVNAFQPEYGGGGQDAFVIKLSPNGDRILYSTYLGGGSDDYGNGIAVDAQGAAYLTGWTRSTNAGPGTFPIVNGAQGTAGGGGADAFAVKIAPSGSSLVYSTYIGGNGQDLGTGIAVDAAGAAYVTGTTSSAIFPTANAFRFNNGGNPFSTYDAFVTKVSPTGNQFLYSTFLGGVNNDQGNRIAVDSAGSAYVTGYTMSPDFPTANAAQPSYGGNTDVFVTKFAPDGRTLSYSTFIGGTNEDQGFGGIAVDASGSAYVTGWTASAQDFPIRNPGQRTYGGGTFDAFAARLAPAGNSLLYSTFIGGSGEDKAYGIAVDLQRNNVYIAGQTSSPDLPSARGSFNPGTGQYDVFVSRLSPDTNVSFGNLAPESLTFKIGGATTPVSQTVQLTSSAAALNFSAFAEPANWLSVIPQNGVTPATLTITVDPTRLTGPATGRITINLPFANNSPLNIPVTVNYTPAPAISTLTPASISAGAADTAVTVKGTGFTTGSVVLLNGVQASTQFVDVNTLRVTIPQNLLASPGTVRVTVSNAGSPSGVVNLNVTAGGPFFTSAGVQNAATSLSGPVAPGEIVTIYGTGFGPSTLTTATVDGGFLGTTLGGTRVLFDNVPAPLVYAQTGQIAAIVPYQVTGQTTTIIVEQNGQRSTPVTVVTVPANPGIFTQDSTGRGQGSILNQDSGLNSPNNPAAKGSVISIFATGEGQTTPAGVTGQIASADNLPKPQQGVTVRIAGVEAPVQYAGAVPGSVTGLLQVNVTVPQNIPSGQLPIVLSIGGTSSRSDVTVSVQ